MPGMEGYIDDIQEAGQTGLGKAGKYAKKDLLTMRSGRIEEAGRLAPVLSAINANKANSYKTAERALRTNLAFEDSPYLLTEAMLQETAGQLDENASNQFANAAAGAYSDAESVLDRNRFARNQMKLNAAVAAGSLARNSMYDRSRKGGVLQGLIQE